MKKPLSTFKMALGLLFFLHTNTISAGSPSRPYLIWINLHEKSKPNITNTIREYIESLPGDEFCNDSAFGWIVYAKSRPAGFTDGLVRDALDHHNSAARRSLASRLRSFRAPPDIDDGMDGIVAYSEAKEPRMISIDAHGIIKNSKTIENINDAEQVVDTFCSVMPEIYRK